MENEKKVKNIYQKGLQLEGRNAVLEALNNDREIDKIWLKKGEVEGSLKLIKSKAYEKGIVVQEVSKNKLNEIAMTHNHQGIIATCPSHNYCEVSDILDYAKSKNEDPFILILDGITDTHNLGAIIRSAESFGVHGIILPKRRSATLTGIVSKTSAGAIEYMKIAKVVNVTRTIEQLQKEGLWVYCADMGGEPIYNTKLTGPVCLVVGSEGEGVSRLVKEKSDFTVNIPMYGKISSLNASVATGVALYEVSKQRHM